MQKSRTSQDTSDLHQYLSLGQFMSVEILNLHKDRFNTTLIGLKPQKFLLLELPNIVKRGELYDRMILNNNLMIRTICELTTGDCLAFETSASRIIKVPHSMMYLDYPLLLNFQSIRKEDRKHLFIPAALRNPDSGLETEGTIVDISAGGCRLELTSDEILETAEDSQLEIRYRSPESGTETKRQVRVCSKRKKAANGVYAGLAFSGDP